jgi:hypothetical protein
MVDAPRKRGLVQPLAKPAGERPRRELDSPRAGRAMQQLVVPRLVFSGAVAAHAVGLRVASRSRAVLSRSPLKPWLSSLPSPSAGSSRSLSG